MPRAVSAADANGHFSRLLQGVREGRTYVVTSHGRPVAKIVPIDTDQDRRSMARAVLFRRLRHQRVARIGPWTRDELHEE